MIKMDLITGFLGSGKTTFLKKYAGYLKKKGEHFCILEYDYGAVNIDVMILKELQDDRCGLEMVAAACDADCLRRRLKTKLISMAMCGYSRVVLEPSGVFDMDEFFDLLREEPLDRWYEAGNVLTIVNARLPEDLTAEDDFLLASQAACAGKILFSRAQLASEDEIRRTRAHLSRAMKAIRCDASAEEKLEGRILAKDWEQFTEEDLASLSSCGFQKCDYVKTIAGQESSSFSSLCFLSQIHGLESLKTKSALLFSSPEYGKVFRVKGFVKEQGRFYLMNAAPDEVTTEAVRNGQDVVIVIGTDLDEKKIRALLTAK